MAVSDAGERRCMQTETGGEGAAHAPILPGSPRSGRRRSFSLNNASVSSSLIVTTKSADFSAADSRARSARPVSTRSLLPWAL